MLLINALIIFATTTRVFMFAYGHNPEQIDIFINAYITHSINLVILTVAFYFSMKFAQNTINKSNKDADIKDKQNKTLLKMAKGIEKSSEQIYKASKELSNSSLRLSENANEQAASTEELAGSMEEMASILSANTQNAEITGQTTTKSAKEITKSKEAFSKTIEVVSTISHKTNLIIDIASKTNLLSINASIEAARAGGKGKGFEIVAQEIRKLADKSKMASDEITALSADGQNISKLADEKLNELIPEILKSAELVDSIIRASKEQESGIHSINDSIQQLSQITNENSVAAEEMATSAELLLEQANQLRKLVAEFNEET